MDAPGRIPEPPSSDAPAAGEARPRSKVHTWPYLVRLEVLAALVVMIGLVVWSITVDAPLEEPANPFRTPNPSKAPWYFLGLQEMLVYFDPWMAGVVLPTLIIVGLVMIPYVDPNPKGNGYYTLRERPFAIGVYLFGFLVLWLALIGIGAFLRGPGWYFFLPGQYRDPHKAVAITSVDWPWLLGCRSAVARNVVGGVSTLVLFGWPLLALPLVRRRAFFRRLGAARYAIVGLLFAAMTSLPVKMILRWTLDVKYVWANRFFNV